MAVTGSVRGAAPVALQVDQLADALSSEDMVTPADPLGEAQPQQERTELLEADVGIRAPAEDLSEDPRPGPGADESQGGAPLAR